MNMQVCVPYEECPFKCPMCIAKGRKTYKNLYKFHKDLYLEELGNKLDNLEIQDVVLTGGTDPSLNRKWLTYVSRYIKDEFSIDVELQTKNYNLKHYDLSNIDVLSYSITSIKDYLKAWSFRKIDRTNRLVILLTKEFDFLTAENFDTMGFEQITFKVLQYGQATLVNDWIEENEMQDFTKIYDIVNKFNGTKTSIRIDTSCQDSEERYYIFREDGKVYNGWGE